MGGIKKFLSEGGFSESLYYAHPDYDVVEINGVRGKVLLTFDDPTGEHYSLPSCSNSSTPTIYFKVDENNEVVQGRLYIDRQMVLDFDWDHGHRNKRSGEAFVKGTVHVQEYGQNKKGKTVRYANRARLMTDFEIEKYGPIIHKYNPNVKFR